METTRWLLAVAIAACALSSTAAQAQRKNAQPTVDARWLPYIGCWSRTADASASAALTCVKPGAGSSADIITVTNGTIDSREHLVVDAQPHAIDKDGCSGTQTATWASSGNRIYVGSAYTCGNSLRGRSTRMFAILPSGVWLEVRDVHAGGGWVETVTRFHDAGLPTSVPADIRSEISHHELAVTTARAAASAPATASDIAEASRSVDTAVVQSWLSARGQAYVGDAPVVATQTNTVRVYEGSPAPQPAPAPQMVEPPCDQFGCYDANVYSSYNGTVFTSYARPYVYAYPPYYPGFIAPVVVVRGSPNRGRPPVIRPPAGHGPVGHSPLGHTPIGAAPPRIPATHPTGHTPRTGPPMRGRP
jgi:hypothetical protein